QYLHAFPTRRSSDLLKYIMVLMSGTLIAQLLGFIFAPIITRLYTPAEAGELGLFIRVISFGAAIGTLRYEQALPILKADTHSFRSEEHTSELQSREN